MKTFTTNLIRWCLSFQRYIVSDGSAGQVVSVAGARARRGHGVGAGAGQQRQEHAAQRAASARTARRAHHAHCRTSAAAVH